jgi:uncharacterized membrane protein
LFYSFLPTLVFARIAVTIAVTITLFIALIILVLGFLFVFVRYGDDGWGTSIKPIAVVLAFLCMSGIALPHNHLPGSQADVAKLVPALLT